MMLLDIHHKYLGLILITYEDIKKVKWDIFFQPHSREIHFIKEGTLLLLTGYPMTLDLAGHLAGRVGVERCFCEKNFWVPYWVL